MVVDEWTIDLLSRWKIKLQVEGDRKSGFEYAARAPGLDSEVTTRDDLRSRSEAAARFADYIALARSKVN